MPAYLTPDARDLIRRLMKRQVSMRLGSGANDAEPIKKHQFFKLTNWADVIARRLEPPIKPVLVSERFKIICLNILFERFFFTEERRRRFTVRHTIYPTDSRRLAGFLHPQRKCQSNISSESDSVRV